MNKRVAFGITLFRGALATTFGILLLFNPDKTLNTLANFMGMFWLVSGIVSLRWGVVGERAHGWAIAAGLIGIVAGASMLGGPLIERWIAQEIMLSLLGVIILLTGILHALGGFHVGEGQHRKWYTTSFLLGIFEVVLGLMLIIEPLGRDMVFYLAASTWALTGGFILITEAIRIRKSLKEST
jgi:uncharacterized membrane protein HdeD (DUF308 family)